MYSFFLLHRGKTFALYALPNLQKSTGCNFLLFAWRLSLKKKRLKFASVTLANLFNFTNFKRIIVKRRIHDQFLKFSLKNCPPFPFCVWDISRLWRWYLLPNPSQKVALYYSKTRHSWSPSRFYKLDPSAFRTIYNTFLLKLTLWRVHICLRIFLKSVAEWQCKSWPPFFLAWLSKESCCVRVNFTMLQTALTAVVLSQIPAEANKYGSDKKL